MTGDRSHFGAFYGKTLGGVTVHSPRSLAEMLLIMSRCKNRAQTPISPSRETT